MCALCRRNLLAGERYRRWQPEPVRAERPVCQLCEPEAMRTGWSLADAEPSREGTGGVRWGVRLVA